MNKERENEIIKKLVDNDVRSIKTFDKDGNEVEAYCLLDNYTYFYRNSAKPFHRIDTFGLFIEILQQ